jgi:glycogen synthase
MKLLLYTHSFAPNVGGQETIVMLQARGLAQSSLAPPLPQIELTLATPTPRDGMNDATLPFRVVRQPSRMTLFQLIREADIVHLAGPTLLPIFLALLLRKPTVVEHHGFQTVCPNGQLLYEPDQSTCPGHFMARRYRACLRCNAAQGSLRSLRTALLTFVRRWICQQVSVNILPTAWLATVLQLNRMEPIVHGLPPLEATPTRDNVPSVPTFVFLGRLVSTKGVRILLKAAQHMKSSAFDFRVKIIGQGPEREVLERMARELEIEDVVEFLGYVPTDLLERDLVDATAVIIPSLAGEVFGMVAAQSMQHGRVVIVSDIGALSEVVGDGGLKTAPGDALALANCMQRVSANPRLRDDLGHKASERIANYFSADQMVREHLRVYEALYKARQS